MLTYKKHYHLVGEALALQAQQNITSEAQKKTTPNSYYLDVVFILLTFVILAKLSIYIE